jgi:hypothetical protein
MYLQSCLLSVSTHGKIPTSRGWFVHADSQQIRMLLLCVNVNKQTLGKEELYCDVKRAFVAPGIGSARIAAQACPLPPLIVSAAPTSLAHALDRTANTAASNLQTVNYQARMVDSILLHNVENSCLSDSSSIRSSKPCTSLGLAVTMTDSLSMFRISVFLCNILGCPAAAAAIS